MTDNLPAIQKDKSLVKVNHESKTEDVILYKDFTFGMVIGALAGAFIGLFLLRNKKNDTKALPEPQSKLEEGLSVSDEPIETKDVVVPEQSETSEIDTDDSESQVLPDVSTSNNRVVDVSKFNN